MSLFYSLAYCIGLKPWATAGTREAARISAMFDREESGPPAALRLRARPRLRHQDPGGRAGRRGWQITGVEIVTKVLRAARERARYPRDARCRWLGPGFIGVVLSEFKRAVAAEQHYEHLKRASAAALARDGILPTDIPRRIFEEFY
jgi:hypothetical protein